jgi:hypothetical protein
MSIFYDGAAKRTLRRFGLSVIERALGTLAKKADLKSRRQMHLIQRKVLGARAGRNHP